MNFEILNSTTPLGSILMVLVLGGLLAVVRYVKRTRPEEEHRANLIQWFSFIFMPAYVVIGGVYASDISPLWIYLVFVIGGALFIGIGVRNAYHHKDGWSKDYVYSFVLFIVIILLLGILFSSIVWVTPMESLFP